MGQINDKQIGCEQIRGLWTPGPKRLWNSLCIWLWSRRPYCLASQCFQQASVLKPPPPAALWNLFTAALGGLLEKPLRGWAQTEGELTNSWTRGPSAGRGGSGAVASSGNEARALTLSPPQPLFSPPHTSRVPAVCQVRLQGPDLDTLVQTLPLKHSRPRVPRRIFITDQELY